MIWQLLLIVIVAICVIGPKELPHLAQKLGRTLGRLNQMKQQTHQAFDQHWQEMELAEREKQAQDVDKQYQQQQ